MYYHMGHKTALKTYLTIFNVFVCQMTAGLRELCISIALNKSGLHGGLKIICLQSICLLEFQIKLIPFSKFRCVRVRVIKFSLIKSKCLHIWTFLREVIVFNLIEP